MESALGLVLALSSYSEKPYSNSLVTKQSEAGIPVAETAVPAFINGNIYTAEDDGESRRGPQQYHFYENSAPNFQNIHSQSTV
ncbi:hypothetical protein [Microbulbifer sp. TRSA005]|uniref:hypothetical protein n=1 Tax=Microbulbifer sp. TRSA005 TaxID=3243383 RepID=UPI004039AD02